MSLIRGVVPRAWKRARVVPIFKSSDISSLNNYRPISILPIVSKFVERTVHKQRSEFFYIRRVAGGGGGGAVGAVPPQKMPKKKGEREKKGK